MATTAVINWIAQAGIVTQELYYGKDSVVTGLPGAGTGWTAHSGNPLAAIANTATVTGLDDNIKYKYLVRSICASNQSTFSQITGMKVVCTSLSGSVVNPSAGTFQYSFSVPSSLSSAGTIVTGIKVILDGKSTITGARYYAEKTYTPPFSPSYTDTVNGINESYNWNAYLQFVTGVGQDVPLIQCAPPVTFSTGTSSLFIMSVRDGMKDGVISDLQLGAGNSVVLSDIQPGTLYKADTSLLGGAINDVIYGTLSNATVGGMYYLRVLRGVSHTQVYAGNFVYTGPGAAFTSTSVSMQGGDIIEILDGGQNGVVPKQALVSKVITPDNGYDVIVEIDFPQAGATTYDVTFSSYSYGSGAAESYTRTVTILAGQTVSNTVHVTSSMNNGSFTDATIASACVTAASSNITVPTAYLC